MKRLDESSINDIAKRKKKTGKNEKNDEESKLSNKRLQDQRNV